MRVAIFLPCRSGSQRIENKCLRPFAGREDGLLGVKLDQLSKVRGVDAIVLDSNDHQVLEAGRRRQSDWRSAAELIVRERPDELGRSTTATDSLIAYALATVECDVLCWTHVTSPLVEAKHYEQALETYWNRDRDRFDSLMAVTPIRTFLWSSGRPLNYSPEKLRWPRTQDTGTVYEVNSAFFAVDRALGQARRDRVGERPLLYELDKLTSADVDWPEDFALAESLYSLRHQLEVAQHG